MAEREGIVKGTEARSILILSNHLSVFPSSSLYSLSVVLFSFRDILLSLKNARGN